MRSLTSKGIAALLAAVVCMGAFAGTASAISEVYWDGLHPPGASTSYNHTLTQASSRTISGQGICVRSYRASDGVQAGPIECNQGTNALATVNYPCVCTLLHAATNTSHWTNLRARIDF